MEFRHLGRTGLKVSILSYGAWVSFGNQVDVQAAKGILSRCREAGVNFFDNAEVYANGNAEEIMGQAIKELGWKRSDVVISTKIFWGGQGPNDVGLSRKHIIEGTQACLKRLQMDYVDVLFCHRPDDSTPIEETVRAMNFVIDKGWAFYWGTSEWDAQQITEACEVAIRLGLVGPSVEQPQYNLLSRERVEAEYLPLYKNYGLGLTTWSPLGSGVLTGKYSRTNIPNDSRFALRNYKVVITHFSIEGFRFPVIDVMVCKVHSVCLKEASFYLQGLADRKLVDEVLDKVEKLKAIADGLKVPLSQLAIAWCVCNPNVSTVITGATKESQVVENMKAVEVMKKLTPKVIEQIEDIVQSKPKKPDVFR